MLPEAIIIEQNSILIWIVKNLTETSLLTHLRDACGLGNGHDDARLGRIHIMIHTKVGGTSVYQHPVIRRH